jgi:hypothetical protein
MNDKCPKCGADRVIGPGGVKVWRCGYCPDEEDGFRETWDCLRRQRDQLEADFARYIKLDETHPKSHEETVEMLRLADKYRKGK